MIRKPHGSWQHTNLIQQIVEELILDGYNVVNCHGVMPDAVATKNGKIYAVEALLVQDNSSWTKNKINQKRIDYAMFDDVIFKTARRNKNKDIKNPIETRVESKSDRARRIVDECILELIEKSV